ncbi:MAG: hypothetical protein ACTHOK_07125 [Nocardioidaceae bacterium]
MTLIAWVCAVAGCVGYGVASVLQSVGSARASGPAVMVQPLYVVGLVLDGLAWLVSLVALRVLPLFVVQSVLAGSVAVTVVLAWRVLGTRLRPRDGVAIGVMALALGTLAAAFPASGAPAHASTGWLLAGLAVLAAGTAAAYARGGSVLLAALAGAAFAGAAVCARAADLTGGASAIVAEPLVWAILGFGAAGTLAYARSLERGAVGPATAVLWSFEAVLGGLAGMVALGDAVRPGWAPVAALAVLAALACCGVLATGPAQQALGAAGPEQCSGG